MTPTGNLVSFYRNHSKYHIIQIVILKSLKFQVMKSSTVIVSSLGTKQHIFFLEYVLLGDDFLSIYSLYFKGTLGKKLPCSACTVRNRLNWAAQLNSCSKYI